jgi:hypothetical protein
MGRGTIFVVAAAPSFVCPYQQADDQTVACNRGYLLPASASGRLPTETSGQAWGGGPFFIGAAHDDANTSHS